MGLKKCGAILGPNEISLLRTETQRGEGSRRPQRMAVAKAAVPSGFWRCSRTVRGLCHWANAVAWGRPSAPVQGGRAEERAQQAPAEAGPGRQATGNAAVTRGGVASWGLRQGVGAGGRRGKNRDQAPLRGGAEEGKEGTLRRSSARQVLVRMRELGRGVGLRHHGGKD